MTPDDPLLDALVQNTFRVTAVLTRVGAEHDLSLTQLRVLGILRDRRARMSDLAAFLGLDKSSLSGLIDRAEKRGLLAREKSPGDRRVIEVFTTDAGLELAGTVYAEIRRELAPSMDRLDPQQREQLTGLMGVLLEHF